MQRNTYAAVRALKETNTPSMSFPLFRGTPLPFQAAGAEIAYRVKRLLLMDPVGLGKTVQSALLIAKFMQDYRDRVRRSARVLVAVEADHVFQWRNELRRFLNVDPLIPTADKKSRDKMYNLLASRDHAVVLVNHSKLFVDYDNIVNKLRPDLFIVDEAAIVANKNKTHQFATWVARTCDTVMLLTAEPISRGDLVQIRNCFLVLGIDLCDSEEEFIDRFVHVERKQIWAKGRSGNFRKTILIPRGAKNVDEFKKLIYPNALRRPETVLGEKRLINRQLVTVDMAPVMRERYAEVERRIITARHAKREIDPITTAAYLSQILCSPWLVDDAAPKESPKAEAVVRLAKRLAPNKLVVFSKWKKMHTILAEHFHKNDIKALFFSGDYSTTERHETIEKFWADPNQQVLVMTAAGQRGLNLQVTNNICIIDLLHSPAAMRQLIGRLDRIGQQSKVINFYIVVANDSTEMGIMKVLKERQTVLDRVFDEAKASLFDDTFSPEELLLRFDANTVTK